MMNRDWIKEGDMRFETARNITEYWMSLQVIVQNLAR